jgi:GTPase
MWPKIGVSLITKLDAYSHDVAMKPRIIALNKIDALDDEERAEKKAALEQICGRPVYMISAVSGEGMQEVLRALLARIDRAKPKAEDDGPWQP